jgi:hypothetical protein
MISFMQKTVVQINEEVKSGGSVVVTAAPDTQPAPAAPAAVDVVTSATFAKNIYLPPMPVMFPPQPKKE